MSHGLDRISQILADAEKELRQVIADAAQQGEYRTVDAARLVAVSISETKTRFSDRALHPRTKDSNPAKQLKKSASRSKPTSSKTKRTAYPKFEIRSGSLVKIGWSKKQKKEYSHKVPHSVFQSTVDAMANLSATGTGPFLAEQLLARINETESDLIPSYQVYVVIAFLREKKCLKQQGREGYSIPPDVQEQAKKIWENIA